MATRVPLRFLRRGVFCIPGPGKERSGGEDAFFCTPTALGVADGVGSWINEGIDPSLYPRKLMSAALNSSLKTPTELAKINEFPPLAILQEAYQAAAKARVLGSSTAVVCSMLDENRLGILNVGDSGIRIVRNGSLLFGSAEGTFSFNFPYQLGPTSDFRPAQGERAIITLLRGDVIVLASDGVLDNVYDDDIIKFVSPLAMTATGKDDKEVPSLLTPAQAAEDLAKFAFKLSRTRSGTSPFGARAKEAGHHYDGGKPDDITVVLAVADEDSKAQAGPAQPQLEALKASDCPVLLEDFLKLRQSGLSGSWGKSRL